MSDKRTLPEWNTGTPEKKGVYVCFSDNPRRTDGADLYHWDGKLWQHNIGWYDHAITHWMLIQEID